MTNDSPFFSLSRKLDYMRITTWAEYGVICAASHECSIRPVWVMLQRRIDEVLEGVRLSDLLEAEPTVRRRVGLPMLQG